MTRRRKWAAHLRAKLLAGLVVTVPAVATVLALGFVLRRVDSLLGPAVARLLGHEIPGLGIVATFLLVLLVGIVATNLVGRRLIGLVERVFTNMPFVRRIYGASKDIVESATLTREAGFRDVVMVEYPRRGTWAYGFVTSYVTRHDGNTVESLANVFIPTPPVPTSGVLLAVPAPELRFLDIPVEDALKLVLSAGLAAPATLVLRPSPPTAGHPPPAAGPRT